MSWRLIWTSRQSAELRVMRRQMLLKTSKPQAARKTRLLKEQTQRGEALLRLRAEENHLPAEHPGRHPPAVPVRHRIRALFTIPETLIKTVSCPMRKRYGMLLCIPWPALKTGIPVSRAMINRGKPPARRLKPKAALIFSPECFHYKKT